MGMKVKWADCDSLSNMILNQVKCLSEKSGIS